jgi:hypothetical protein
MAATKPGENKEIVAHDQKIVDGTERPLLACPPDHEIDG